MHCMASNKTVIAEIYAPKACCTYTISRRSVFTEDKTLRQAVKKVQSLFANLEIVIVMYTPKAQALRGFL